jgi:DNA-binding CsgD family transcriptional regulator
VGHADVTRAIAGWLEERGRSLDRPWALGAAARCRGLLASADRDLDRAAAELDDALAVHEALGWPFEVARTLLCLGGVHRRAKRKKASRDVLERAAAVFVGLGSPVWAERARAEEARIGGRRAAGGGLTEAEQRVHRLVLAGLTNREIADALYMSVRTVEGHVSHILRKLGARSRTELVALGDAARDEPSI